MKTVKSLLLGSAAGFVAITGAQAADLPMAEPVEYVKVCSTYGEGFFYIPGTDTCLQISGKARADFLVFDDDTDANPITGDINDGVPGTGDDDFGTDIRGVIAADARSETEWGTLRAYIEFEGRSRGNGAYPNGDGDHSGGGQDVALISAFVQFAGITAGLAPSFYDFVEYDTIGDFFSKEDVNTLAYTASFGSGFAATIAIEDKYYRASSVTSAEDQVWPNIVAALRIDQAWGSAQISAAVQDNEGDDVAGPGEDDMGWAVQAGAAINLPTAVEGSKVFIQGAYSEGALSYAGAEDFRGNGGNFSLVFPDQSGEVNNELWTVGGGVSFAATEEVIFNLIGLYGEYTDAGDATNDAEIVSAEGNINWNPVDNLAIYVGGQYLSVEEDDGDESDAWVGFLRFERGF